MLTSTKSKQQNNVSCAICKTYKSNPICCLEINIPVVKYKESQEDCKNMYLGPLGRVKDMTGETQKDSKILVTFYFLI